MNTLSNQIMFPEEQSIPNCLCMCLMFINFFLKKNREKSINPLSLAAATAQTSPTITISERAVTNNINPSIL